MKPDGMLKRQAVWGGILWLLLGLAAPAVAGELAGTLDWGRRLELGPLVSGIVEQVAVAPGERVRKGQTLLTLDGRGFRADLAAAKAAARHAAVLLEEARREHERAQELYDRSVLSEHERIVAVIGLREAQAAARRAEAQRVAAALALERSRLTAPFDGLVVAVRATPGQAVNARLQVPTLLVLADDRELRVAVRAEPAVARELQQAQGLRVELAGRELPVVRVQPGTELVREGARRLLPLELVVERPADLAVRAGEPVRVRW